MSGADAIEAYIEIHREWNRGSSYESVYDLVLDWCLLYMSRVQNSWVVYDVLDRIEDGEHQLTIVNDFMYGELYRPLREEMRLSGV